MNDLPGSIGSHDGSIIVKSPTQVLRADLLLEITSFVDVLSFAEHGTIEDDGQIGRFEKPVDALEEVVCQTERSAVGVRARDPSVEHDDLIEMLISHEPPLLPRHTIGSMKSLEHLRIGLGRAVLEHGVDLLVSEPVVERDLHALAVECVRKKFALGCFPDFVGAFDGDEFHDALLCLGFFEDL